jgi:pilus assembly protein Flp/PilA
MLRRLCARRPHHSERGATAVEYALMVALIAIVIVGAVKGLGTSLTSIFANAANRI